MQQERALIAALEATSTYRIMGQTLDLFDGRRRADRPVRVPLPVATAPQSHSSGRAPVVVYHFRERLLKNSLELVSAALVELNRLAHLSRNCTIVGIVRF